MKPAPKQGTDWELIAAVTILSLGGGYLLLVLAALLHWSTS